MAKPSKNRERAERIEALRRESQRAERRRTLVVVIVCGVLALAIVGATAWKLISDAQREDDVAGTDIADIGPDADAAGCGDITTAPSEDEGVHPPEGQDIDYSQYGTTPPAFGAHWGLVDFDRKFYTEADRPEVEALVHNLEHGYTVMWYDESIADDPDAVQTMEDLAEKFEETGSAAEIGADVETYNTGKFIAAPWTEEDGEFPADANVVLTHWAFEGGAFEGGEATGEGQGVGVWQSCDQPSGDAVASFMEEYPASNSPEPEGA